MILLRVWEMRKRSCQICVLVFIVVVIILLLTTPSPAPQCHRSGPREWSADGTRNFAIRTTWNGQCTNHEAVRIALEPAPNGDVIMRVYAPFFNSPGKPNGPPGQPFPGLWDYEVVEAFFLNDDKQYLEIELSPHGQHLLLLLNGQRQMIKDQLPITYTATIASTGDKWTGFATIPRDYFPPGVTKFNAYAINGEGDARQYESLYPLNNQKPEDKPDFHRLELFQSIDMSTVMNNFNPKELSKTWRAILQS